MKTTISPTDIIRRIRSVRLIRLCGGVASSVTSTAVAVAVAVAFVAAPAHAQDASTTLSSVNVCDRTPQVRAAIVAEASGAIACQSVFDDDLGGITALDLSNQNIRELRAGDFSGLYALESLDLSGNDRLTLLDGALSGLTLNLDAPDDINPNGALRTLVLPRLAPTSVVPELRYRQQVFLTDVTDDGRSVTKTLNLPEIHLTWTRPATGYARDGNNVIRPNRVTGYRIETSRDGITYTELVANTSTLSSSPPAGPTHDSFTEDGEPVAACEFTDGVCTRNFIGGNYAPNVNTFVHRENLSISTGDLLYYRVSAHIDLGTSASPDVGVGPTAIGDVSAPETRSDLCSRTPAVIAAVIDYLGEDKCEDVSIRQLASIRLLPLSDKGVGTLSSGDFRGMPALEAIDLSNNGLTELPQGVFDELGNLEVLFLNGNALTTLPEFVFAPLQRLVVLRLDNNQLTQLPGDIFGFNPNLRVLTLNDNETTDDDGNTTTTLTTLPPSLYDILPSLSRLLVDPMPISALSGEVTNVPINGSPYSYDRFPHPDVVLNWLEPYRTDGGDRLIGFVGYEDYQAQRVFVSPSTGRVLLRANVRGRRGTTIGPGVTGDIFRDMEISYDIEESLDGTTWRTVVEGLNNLSCVPFESSDGREVCTDRLRAWQQPRALQDPVIDYAEPGSLSRHYRVTAVFRNTARRPDPVIVPPTDFDPGAPGQVNTDSPYNFPYVGNIPDECLFDPNEDPFNPRVPTDAECLPTQNPGDLPPAGVAGEVCRQQLNSRNINLFDADNNPLEERTTSGRICFIATPLPEFEENQLIRTTPLVTQVQITPPPTIVDPTGVVNVCDRTPQIEDLIVATTGAACDEVTRRQISNIRSMDLDGAISHPTIEYRELRDSFVFVLRNSFTPRYRIARPRDTANPVAFTETRAAHNGDTLITRSNIYVIHYLLEDTNNDGRVFFDLLDNDAINGVTHSVTPGGTLRVHSVPQQPDASAECATAEARMTLVANGYLCVQINQPVFPDDYVQPADADFITISPCDPATDSTCILPNPSTNTPITTPLTALQPGDFADMSGLRGLSMRNNQLTTLPSGVFEGLDYVVSINLSENQLATLPADVFADTPRLQTLNLSYNALTAIEEGLFDGLSRLNTLLIHEQGENGFDAFPRSLLADTRLSRLTNAPGGETEDLTLRLDRMMPEQLSTEISIVDRALTFNWMPPLISSTKASALQSGGSRTAEITRMEVDVRVGTGAWEPIQGGTVGITETSRVYNPTTFAEAQVFTFRTRAEIEQVSNPDPDADPDAPDTTLTLGSVWSSYAEISYTIGDLTDPGNVCDRADVFKNAILVAVQYLREGPRDPNESPADRQRRLNTPTIDCMLVSTDELAAIPALDLSAMRLTELTRSDLAGMPNLISLNLAGNQLTELPNFLFDLPLVTLLVDGNPGLVVPRSLLERLTQLQTLTINPMPPTDLAIAIDDEQCEVSDVSWSAPYTGLNNPTEVLGYRIQASADGDQFQTIIADTFSLVTQYTHTGELPAGAQIFDPNMQFTPEQLRAADLIHWRVAGIISRGANVRIGLYSRTVSVLRPISCDAMEVVEETVINVFNELNQAVLPEVARALIGGASRAITERIGLATRLPYGHANLRSGQSQHVGHFNFAGRNTLAGVMRDYGEYIAYGGDMKPLLGGSNFSLALNAADGGGMFAGEGDLTLWGGGEYRKLAGGDEDALIWGGDFYGAHVGIDGRIGRNGVGGMAVSHVIGEFDFEEFESEMEGEYELELSSAHPYFGWRIGGTEWWATGGSGQGTVEITARDTVPATTPTTPANGNGNNDADDMPTLSSDINMTSYALGVSGQLTSTERLAVRLKSEYSAAILKLEEGGDFDLLEVEAERARLALEFGGHMRPTHGGGRFNREMELGGRYDSGSGQPGGGVELGGGVRYHSPSGRFTADGNARFLIGHRGDYEEWGLHGTLRLQPGADGQGLSFQLSPGYGDTGSGIHRLWQSGLTATQTDRADGYTMRVDAKMGYGLSLRAANGVLTPYSHMTYSGTSTYRMGLRWNSSSRFHWDLLSEQRDSDARNRVLLKGGVKF